MADVINKAISANEVKQGTAVSFLGRVAVTKSREAMANTNTGQIATRYDNRFANEKVVHYFGGTAAPSLPSVAAARAFSSGFSNGFA